MTLLCISLPRNYVVYPLPTFLPYVVCPALYTQHKLDTPIAGLRPVTGSSYVRDAHPRTVATPTVSEIVKQRLQGLLPQPNCSACCSCINAMDDKLVAGSAVAQDSAALAMPQQTTAVN